MKRLLLNYGLLALAGVFSFLLALNVRVIALMIYRSTATDPIMLAGSLINAATVIIVMVLWIIYIFYLQHRIDKNCTGFDQYRRAVLVYILPMPVLYGLSEMAIRFAISG